MIKPPSLVAEYDLVYSGDPALDAPPHPERAHGISDDDHVEALKAFYSSEVWQAWLARLRVAQNAGTEAAWSAVLKPGEKPTRFVMRQVPGTVWRKVLDQINTGKLDEATGAALVFRTAIVGIRDLGVDGVDVTMETDAVLRERIAARSVVDKLDAIHPAIVSELGNVVWRRMNNPDPLS